MKCPFSLKLLCSVFAGLAGSLAYATDWHWSPTATSGGYYLWSNFNNWTNSAGERGVGYPAAGDKVFLGQYKQATFAYNVDGSRFLHTIQIGPASGTSINQGNWALQAGGGGLQYLANADCKGNWSGMYFKGDGEIPINIANKVTYSMQMRMNVSSGKPVIVKTGPGTFNCFNEGGGNGAYTLPLVLIRQGVWNMATKACTISGVTVAFDGNDASTRLQYSYASSWSADLLLKDSAIIETNGVANATHGIVSDYDHQVHFTGTPKVNPMVFSGTFYNKAGLNWEPSSADRVFVCSNAVSATTGRVIVGKGRVKLVTGASFTALSALSVAAGAVFEVEPGSGANFHAEQLTLGGGTVPALNLGSGVSLAVTAATYNGTALPPGTYAAEAAGEVRRAAWITGAGQVVVATGPSSSDTWSGAGANADVTTDANWSLGTAPDIASGELLATFASGGASASLPANTNAAFNGITLNNTSGGNAFAFTAGAGAAASVGANGIVASSAAAATWSMGWPLAVGEAETWTVGANDTLSVDAGISGAGDLTFDGSGTVIFNSALSHTGALALQAGTVRVLASDGLGPASCAVTAQTDKVALSFGGDITVSSPLTLTHASSGSAVRSFSVEPNARVTFTGLVTQYEEHLLTVGAGATLVFSNGCKAVNTGMNGRLYPRGSGTIVIENTALVLPFQICCASDNPVAFDFRTTGNNFKTSRDYNWSLFTGPIYTRVANVFAARQWIQLRGPDAVFDLCGTDQSVMLLHGETGTRVTSATPATLTVTSLAMSEYQDNTGAGGTNRVDLAAFGGLVSFRKTGPTIHTFGATSASSGTVTVAEGPLVFNANGKWPNASEVRVEGGLLTLGNAEALGSNTIWRVTTGSAPRVEIAGAGQTNFCERLYVDGRRQVGGLYGASGSGAPKEAAWLAGAGVLQVAEHGLVIFLR